MGLDVGSKTVGVAISDELNWTAQSYKTIQISEEQGRFGYDEIEKIIQEFAIDMIVIGLPKNMNGTLGPRAIQSQKYADELKKRFSVQVVLWDERLTTVAVEKMLISANVRREKRKKVVDQMAASLILQGYLDSLQK